jgi:hypothetical protein
MAEVLRHGGGKAQCRQSYPAVDPNDDRTILKKITKAYEDGKTLGPKGAENSLKPETKDPKPGLIKEPLQQPSRCVPIPGGSLAFSQGKITGI